MPQTLNPKPFESRLLGPPLLLGGPPCWGHLVVAPFAGAALLWPPLLGPPCCSSRLVLEAAFVVGEAALMEAMWLLLRLPW